MRVGSVAGLSQFNHNELSTTTLNELTVRKWVPADNGARTSLDSRASRDTGLNCLRVIEDQEFLNVMQYG